MSDACFFWVVGFPCQLSLFVAIFVLLWAGGQCSGKIHFSVLAL